MAHKTIEGETSVTQVTNFLEDRGCFLPLEDQVQIGDEPGHYLIRRAYDIVIPRGWLKELLLGIGGDSEPVIMSRWPHGEVELVASNRMLRFIDRELKNPV